VTLAWLADHNITKPNICFCTRNAAFNPNHKSKLNRVEGGFHLHCDRRDGVGAGLAHGQVCKDDIIVADASESICVGIIAVLKEGCDE
jgi:hypothetical protein